LLSSVVRYSSRLPGRDARAVGRIVVRSDRSMASSERASGSKPIVRSHG
jgi:hypothetical protein